MPRGKAVKSTDLHKIHTLRDTSFSSHALRDPLSSSKYRVSNISDTANLLYDYAHNYAPNRENKWANFYGNLLIVASVALGVCALTIPGLGVGMLVSAGVIASFALLSDSNLKSSPPNQSIAKESRDIALKITPHR